MAILATTVPFFLLLFFTLVLRRSLWQSGIIAFLSALGLWGFAPGVGATDLAPPLVKAFIVSTEVGLILFGAISFLETMNRTGTTVRIKSALGDFTAGDRTLAALLLAWLFCGFLEGAAGFGAPAAIIAPLLLALGFSPLTAAVLPLIGDSAAVPFGAVGTPVRVGFDGLAAGTAGIYGAGIQLLAGLAPPLAIGWLARPEDGALGWWRQGVPLAVRASLCFTVPAFCLAWIGPEFPSMAGSLIGLLLFCLTLPAGRAGRRSRGVLPLIRAFAPYLFLCLLLLVGKLVLGPLRWSFSVAGQEERLGAFQPGLVFLVALAVVVLIGQRDGVAGGLGGVFALAAKRLPFVWLAIFCMAALAQMVVRLSDPAAALDAVFGGGGGGLLLLALAPVAGALGAFIAGSATVSNLLMAPVLFQASAITGTDPGLVLGLQLAGAGAGNMISLQNIAAVQATVGIVDRERDMLLRLWRPFVVYLGLIILCGLLLGWAAG